jgi:hypothetical protein
MLSMVRSLLNVTFHIPLAFKSLKYRTPGEAPFTVCKMEARNSDTGDISRSLDSISINFLSGSCRSGGR